MTRVRTYLDPIRAGQLKVIARYYDFNSVAAYLDAHIATEWRKLYPEKTPIFPGFEIYGVLSEENKPIVIFAANGTVPVTLDAINAAQLSAGIDSVISNRQKSFFIASMVDDSILFFDKKGNGYRFIIKWNSGQWIRGLSESIAKDLAAIIKSRSDQAINKLKEQHQ